MKLALIAIGLFAITNLIQGETNKSDKQVLRVTKDVFGISLYR
jgi:hypothetical protein